MIYLCLKILSVFPNKVSLCFISEETRLERILLNFSRVFDN